MHNAAFQELNMDWCYLPLKVKPSQVQAALSGLAALDLRGANVTIPHKEQVIEFLDEISPAAQALGAVNTIVVEGERLRGDNTDWLGFLRALEEGGERYPSARALVLGAGGAARAVVYALAQEGWEVAILNRTPERAEALAEALSHASPGASLSAGPLKRMKLVRELAASQLLVNATSVGMRPQEDECPVPEDLAIPAGVAVYDLVYNPEETLLLKRAKEAGAKAIGGLGMLLHQGAEAFRLWTGREAPLAVMRQALREGLRG
jgi:shikimate dehydrogenase